MGQLARIKGCRAVGIAGTDEKVQYLKETLGFDAAINYKTAPNLRQALAEACPGGVDVYFDNVGGRHLRAALALANPYGRFVECGMISSYGGSPEPVDNLSLVVGKRLTLRGFLVRDAADRAPLFLRHVGGLLRDGSVRYDETVVEGIEHQFDALRDLLRGGAHRGKLVVDVRGD